jgi:general secretion pathway protein L
MLNLNSTINPDFRKFFRWWKKELNFLVPEKIRALISDKQGMIIVCTRDSQLELTYHLDTGSEPLAIVDRNEAGIAQCKDLLAKDERLAKADVILRLNHQDGIQRELSLPAAVKENLYQVVSYELSRYTPFKPEQVYFSVKPLNVVNEPGQIRVRLILTTREILDTLYEDLKAMGLAPVLADYEGAPNDLDRNGDDYNLLPEGLRPKTAKAPRLIYSALAGAVFLLLGAVVTAPVWLEYQTVRVLQERVDAIEKDARKIKALQSEIDAVIEETRELIEMKNAAPPVVEIFNTLSALIKDDTWLSYAQYSGGHLQIQGESPAASGLIAVLEDSKLFANAKFVSPVTQDTASGYERFQITADISKAGEAAGVQSKE